MKKIYYVTALFICLFEQNINAQAPNWDWVKSGKGPGQDSGNDIATDHKGNSYITGTFAAPTIVFGSDTLPSSNGSTDNFFIAKYDRFGAEQWAKYAGDSTRVVGNSVNVDFTGSSVIATGYFQGGSSPVHFGSYSLTSPGGGYEAFIVKYDTSGNVQWAVSAGKIALLGMSKNITNSVDRLGNIYIAGEFADSVTIIKKYDAAGNFVWNQTAIGSFILGNYGNLKISTDWDGNSFVTGVFTAGSSITFGTTTITNTSSGYEVFIVKYDASGNFVWAKHQGTYPSLYKPAISTDNMGNSYLTGYFLGTYVQFDTIVLANTGGEDIFIVKFNKDGNVVWAKDAGGLNADEGHAIRTDDLGNSYLSGMFRMVATFGTTNLFSVGAVDVFVAKYDSSGNSLWAVQAGGSMNDIANGVSFDSSGNVYVTGSFTSKYSYFGNSSVLNSDTITNPYEVFVAKLLNQSVGITEENNSSLVSIYPNPSNGIYNVFINLPEKDLPDAVEIYNVLGERILSQPCKPGRQYIDLGSASSAIYFMRIQTSSGLIVKKIIKE